MSRGKKLGILCGILVLALLALVLVTRWVSRSGNGSDGDLKIAIPADSVSEIAWSYEGEDLHFVKHGDAWVSADNESFPVDSASLENMIGSLAEIRSYKEITGNEHLSDYGLDPAVLTLTVTADREYVLRFGNENDLDGQVYAESGGEVFLTDSMIRAQFSKRTLDMVLQESIPDMDTVKSAQILHGSNALTLEYDDSGERSYYSGYVWVGSDGKESFSLDTEAVESLLSNLTALRWTATAAYPADSSVLQEYGLDNPAVRAAVRYLDKEGNEGTFQLYVGAETGEGECYVMIPGSDRIYRTGSSLYSELTETELRDLTPGEILAVDWASVKSMTVSLDGKEHVLRPNEGGDSVDDAHAGKQIWKESGTNGTVDLTEALNGLTSLQGEDTEASAAKEILFNVVLERNTANYPQVILTIQESSDGSFVATINGKRNLLLDNASTEEVLEKFRSALKQ